MSVNYCLKPILQVLLLCIVGGAASVTLAQHKEQKENLSSAYNKNSCTNAKQAKFDINCKDSYFLGETPTITISITNTSRSLQTMKEAEHQKFYIEMTRNFDDGSPQTKKHVLDGKWDPSTLNSVIDGPEERTYVWSEPRKRTPKFVKLKPGESTNLELDLSYKFSSYLGVSKYKLTVKSEDGQKVVKEFEVYFDDEKSVAVLAQMLRSDSDDVSDRHLAVYYLAKFSRTKFIALLEEQIKSGNQKQRDFAGRMLGAVKAGNFGPNP